MHLVEVTLPRGGQRLLFTPFFFAAGSFSRFWLGGQFATAIFIKNNLYEQKLILNNFLLRLRGQIGMKEH